MALGAAFAGHLGVTATSGPGMDLKAETIGLAVAMELPLVVIDVQRAGPSTGMPTKTEAADLLQALYGRHGESPLPVVAACTPSDCFDAGHRGGPHRGHPPHAGDPAHRHLPGQLLRALAAARRGQRCPTIDPDFATEPNDDGFMPYVRDEQAGPALGGAGHAGAAPSHRRPREGGRHAATSPTTPANHEHMTRLRAERVSARRACPTSRWTTPTATPSCSCSAGARATARSRARLGACAASRG